MKVEEKSLRLIDIVRESVSTYNEQKIKELFSIHIPEIDSRISDCAKFGHDQFCVQFTCNDNFNVFVFNKNRSGYVISCNNSNITKILYETLRKHYDDLGFITKNRNMSYDLLIEWI